MATSLRMQPPTRRASEPGVCSFSLPFIDICNYTLPSYCPIFSFFCCSFCPLSPAIYNAAPLLDLKCSIVGTISPSPRWGPLGLASSIVSCVMVELHARPISPSLYILYGSVFLNVCAWCVHEKADGRKWTYFEAAVPIICRGFSDWWSSAWVWAVLHVTGVALK